MALQTIYNPATKQTLSIDLGAANAQQQIAGYYQQGWVGSVPKGTAIPQPVSVSSPALTTAPSGGTITLPGQYMPAGSQNPVSYLPGQTLPPGASIIMPPKTIQVAGQSQPPNIEGVVPSAPVYPSDFIGPLPPGAIQQPQPVVYPPDFIGPIPPPSVVSPQPSITIPAPYMDYHNVTTIGQVTWGVNNQSGAWELLYDPSDLPGSVIGQPPPIGQTVGSSPAGKPIILYPQIEQVQGFTPQDVQQRAVSLQMQYYTTDTPQGITINNAQIAQAVQDLGEAKALANLTVMGFANPQELVQQAKVYNTAQQALTKVGAIDKDGYINTALAVKKLGADDAARYLETVGVADAKKQVEVIDKYKAYINDDGSLNIDKLINANITGVGFGVGIAGMTMLGGQMPTERDPDAGKEALQQAAKDLEGVGYTGLSGATGVVEIERDKQITLKPYVTASGAYNLTALTTELKKTGDPNKVLGKLEAWGFGKKDVSDAILAAELKAQGITKVSEDVYAKLTPRVLTGVIGAGIPIEISYEKYEGTAGGVKPGKGLTERGVVISAPVKSGWESPEQWSAAIAEGTQRVTSGIDWWYRQSPPGTLGTIGKVFKYPVAASAEVLTLFGAGALSLAPIAGKAAQLTQQEMGIAPVITKTKWGEVKAPTGELLVPYAGATALGMGMFIKESVPKIRHIGSPTAVGEAAAGILMVAAPIKGIAGKVKYAMDAQLARNVAHDLIGDSKLSKEIGDMNAVYAIREMNIMARDGATVAKIENVLSTKFKVTDTASIMREFDLWKTKYDVVMEGKNVPLTDFIESISGHIKNSSEILESVYGKKGGSVVMNEFDKLNAAYAAKDINAIKTAGSRIESVGREMQNYGIKGAGYVREYGTSIVENAQSLSKKMIDSNTLLNSLNQGILKAREAWSWTDVRGKIGPYSKTPEMALDSVIKGKRDFGLIEAENLKGLKEQLADAQNAGLEVKLIKHDLGGGKVGEEYAVFKDTPAGRAKLAEYQRLVSEEAKFYEPYMPDKPMPKATEGRALGIEVKKGELLGYDKASISKYIRRNYSADIVKQYAPEYYSRRWTYKPTEAEIVKEWVGETARGRQFMEEGTVAEKVAQSIKQQIDNLKNSIKEQQALHERLLQQEQTKATRAETQRLLDKTREYRQQLKELRKEALAQKRAKASPERRYPISMEEIRKSGLTMDKIEEIARKFGTDDAQVFKDAIDDAKSADDAAWSKIEEKVKAGEAKIYGEEGGKATEIKPETETKPEAPPRGGGGTRVTTKVKTEEVLKEAEKQKAEKSLAALEEELGKQERKLAQEKESPSPRTREEVRQEIEALKKELKDIEKQADDAVKEEEARIKELEKKGEWEADPEKAKLLEEAKKQLQDKIATRQSIRDKAKSLTQDVDKLKEELDAAEKRSSIQPSWGEVGEKGDPWALYEKIREREFEEQQRGMHPPDWKPGYWPLTGFSLAAPAVAPAKPKPAEPKPKEPAPAPVPKPKPTEPEPYEPVGPRIPLPKIWPKPKIAPAPYPPGKPEPEPTPEPTPERKKEPEPIPFITPMPIIFPSPSEKPYPIPSPGTQPQPQPKPKVKEDIITETITAVESPAPYLTPTPAFWPYPEPEPAPQPQPAPEPYKPPPKEPTPTKITIIKPPKDRKEKEDKRQVAYGTWIWRHGAYWEVLEPPYDHVVHMKNPPDGAYLFATGKGSAKKTLQIIPKGARPPRGETRVNVGWAEAVITVDSSQPGGGTVKFIGHSKGRPHKGQTKAERIARGEIVEEPKKRGRPKKEVEETVPLESISEFMADRVDRSQVTEGELVNVKPRRNPMSWEAMAENLPTRAGTPTMKEATLSDIEASIPAVRHFTPRSRKKAYTTEREPYARYYLGRRLLEPDLSGALK